MLMQDELGSIARDLLADLERARPGFPDDRAGFASAAAERLRLRLSDLRAHYVSVGQAADFERVARDIEDVMLRRYLTFAYAQNRRERRGGTGVLARIALGVGGFLLGVFLMRAPFSPVKAAWLPFLLFFLAPIIPDVRRGMSTRQHRRKLAELSADMDAAGLALRNSQPF